MERNQITGLLQKYYDGMSNQEEEKKLMDYFLRSDVPEDLDVDRKHFEALADMQNESIEVPADLEANILARLAVEQRPTRRLNTRLLYTITSVAAGLALIVSTFIFLDKQNNLGTYDDPQVAYAETKEALGMVSRIMNKGTEQLAGLSEMDRAMQPLNNLGKVEKAKENLKYLGKFDEGIEKSRGLLSK